MIRFAENSLKTWISSYRRKPIIIRGARQVGKSTLVRMFAKMAKLNLIEINLEKHLYLDDVFKTFNISRILRELEAISGKTIDDKTLIFLDEIQAIPSAIASLRYFYEDANTIPVIAAGSLLEFALSDNDFSMPVGRVDYRYLGPMSFNEYLYNLYPDLIKYISSIEELVNIPDVIHLKLIEKFKEFLFVGGMPEAVLAYKETKDFKEVTSIHRSICDTYIDDFSKYSKNKNLLLLQKIFRAIPLNIGQKVKYSNYSMEYTSKEIKNSIDLLVKAKICNPVYSSDCSGLPLEATISLKTFKLMFLDVGLANHICGLDFRSINVLDNDLLVNKGQITEQFVGQQLICSDDISKSFDLNYWLRENKKGNAEVDFVAAINGIITPIEVKAGKKGTLKSLHQFIALKNVKTAIRLDLNRYSIQAISNKILVASNERNVNYTLISFPLYAVSLLDKDFILEYKCETGKYENSKL